MNPKIKRFLVGIAGAVGALISSLASMDGGMTLTLAQLGVIPLIAWLGVLLAFITGYMNGDTPIKEQLK